MAERQWHLADPYEGCDGTKVVGGIFDDDEGAPGGMIGEFQSRDHARLAAAAPDLLAACKAALKSIRISVEHKGNKTNAYDEVALRAIETAVSKVEGR